MGVIFESGEERLETQTRENDEREIFDKKTKKNNNEHSTMERD
jgi:hypothetical protein